ncbi:MAG TPA: hypothetical protein VHI72_00820 [Hyphomicrobiaceae bacterium]|nr:hypothetical protein [Hyphomicrobiaceae bacterium]
MSVLAIAQARAAPCNQDIADVTKKLVTNDVGSGPTAGSPAATVGSQKGQPPAASFLNKEMEGKGASFEDARLRSGVKLDASQALERARGLDAQGKELECLAEVMNAKQLAGL